MKRCILRWGTLVISIVTLVVVVKAYYLGWDAYGVAITQLKNQGNWVVVTLDEVKFERDKNQEGRTLGFFDIAVRNTLPESVKITSVDWRVLPLDWNKDWIFKELGSRQGKDKDDVKTVHAPTIRIDDDHSKTLPLWLECCTPMTFKKMSADVPANPLNEYCEKGQDNFVFWVEVSLEDDKEVPYKSPHKFRANCVKAKIETMFRWTQY
ncbi:MAG: hypothetical protein RX318_09100 [bacterium]|nr:hypothetical protein [bacterium]